MPRDLEAKRLYQQTYYREWAAGIRRGPPATVQMGKFLALLVANPPNQCWVWEGSKQGRSPHFYGCLRYKGRRRQVHRLAYELIKGPVPDGLELDHLCRNKLCFNPAHLEPVTHAENVARATLERCRNGHEYTPENIYIRPSDGRKRCRACARAAKRRNNRPVAREHRAIRVNT